MYEILAPSHDFRLLFPGTEACAIQKWAIVSVWRKTVQSREYDVPVFKKDPACTCIIVCEILFSLMLSVGANHLTLQEVDG